MNEKILSKYNIGKQTMLNAALDYASRGLAVFPLESQGKKPITAHGLKDATTDPDVVRDMFTKHPYSNIGMACGKQSGGIVVVDIDVDDEKGIDGQDSLKSWEREHGMLPSTAMTLTGRGGNHYLYHTNGDTRSRVACKEGIDIRADGGYIVLPPSIHPNGTQYTWEFDLSDYGITEADKNVIDLMNNGVESGAEFKVPEVIEDGTRNDTLYKLACSMQARGNSDRAIRDAVIAENEEKCSPPLSEDEINRLLTSAFTKEKGTSPYKTGDEKKRETEPLDTFTFNDLMQMDLQPPEFLVDGILPKGVCLLGAPPKSGKSWMALDIAIQVSSGGIFLGRKCKKSGVLYLSLEDSKYRIKNRTMKLQQGRPVSDSLHFAIMADRISPGDMEEGLCKQIEIELEKHPDVELVIIDTLQLVTPSKQRGDDAYSSTYTMLNTIRPFWQERGIGFLLIHHTRKKSINDVDPFETFLGSQALTGATDAMYIINSKKDDDFSDFYGRGRDFEDVSLAIRRDETTCRWITIGTSESVREMRERDEYENNAIVGVVRSIVRQSKGVPTKVRLRDIRQQVVDDYHVSAGTSGKNFSTMLRALTEKMYLYDGIIVKPIGHKTINGVNDTWYEVATEECME